ncbi:hypothetical protein [Kutzneria chonburiensis]|uniref:Uncharacterized protein n=1 Tax=Kutzneria chonburiensis TaxID=1483604 RepID=A0ABV6MNG5_9PSEU|nr:hypothetical protein [Kutzneria chonburiensis]
MASAGAAGPSRDGQALIGEMIWEGTPSAAALAAFGLPAISN